MEKMRDDLVKELKLLAQRIVEAPDDSEKLSWKEQCRELYEKLILVEYSEGLEPQPEPLSGEEYPEVVVEKTDIAEIKEDKNTEPLAESPEPPEEYPTLRDLFVPTFDDIKEDMSQKEEFRDTVSLEETEKMFETKREEPRQLSLNDRLVGKNIQVGLNDRIAFVNKLFNFSQSDFNRVLSRLNDCASKKEALDYFAYQVKPNYNWKGKEDLEERFVAMIERKFMN